MRVGVAVGDWQKVETVAGAVPPPLVSSSSVPNSPEVLTLVLAPAFNWKVLVAIGVPFSSSVYVPGPVMLLPMLVMVKVPWASGVQLALRLKIGTATVFVGVFVRRRVGRCIGCGPRVGHCVSRRRRRIGRLWSACGRRGCVSCSGRRVGRRGRVGRSGSVVSAACGSVWSATGCATAYWSLWSAYWSAWAGWLRSGRRRGVRRRIGHSGWHRRRMASRRSARPASRMDDHHRVGGRHLALHTA